MSNKWLLLRGLTRGNGHWGEFPELLQKAGCEVELLELPGNGTQNSVISPMDPMQVLQILRSRCKWVESKDKFNLCGISLGGMIGLKWAEMFPDELESVVVINTSLGQLSPFYKRLMPINYWKIAVSLVSTDFLKLETLILQMTSNRVDKIAKYTLPFASFSSANKVSFSNFIRQIILANRVKIKTPLKVLTKVVYSAHDRLVSPACGRSVASFLNVRTFENPQAGHDLPLDEPEWLVSVLLAGW